MPETLGIQALDEPSPSQSDPTVLDLQLRALSKKASSGDAPILVRSIDNPARAPKEINKWISSIAELHKSKPAPQVLFQRPMPDLEALMGEWPQAFEEALKTVSEGGRGWTGRGTVERDREEEGRGTGRRRRTERP